MRFNNSTINFHVNIFPLNRFLSFDPLDGFASRLKFHHTLLTPLQFRILNGVAEQRFSKSTRNVLEYNEIKIILAAGDR